MAKETYQEWKKRKQLEGTLQVKVPAQSGTASKNSGSQKSGVTKESYQAWKQRKQEDGTLRYSTAARMNANSITDFFTDASGFFSGYESELQNLGYANSANAYNTRRNSADALRGRGAAISSYLDRHRTEFAPEDYRAFKSILRDYDDAFDQIVGSFKSAADFYSQWDTEEAYNKWNTYNTPEKRQTQYAQNAARLEELKQQKRESSSYQTGRNPYLVGGASDTSLPYAAALQNQGMTSEVDEEITRIEKEMRLYEYGEADTDGFYYGNKVADDYGKYLQDDAFVAASGNRDYQNADRATLSAYDAEQFRGQQAIAQGGYIGEDGNVYDVYGNLAKSNTEPPVQDKLGMFLSASDEDISEAYTILNTMGRSYPTTWASILQEGDTKRWKYLKDDELSIYYGLLNTEGQDAAYRYLDAMEVELGRRERMQSYAAVEEASGWEQVLVNAASVPLNLIGGLAAGVDNIGRLVSGKGVNPYSRAQNLLASGNYIRANTAGEIDAATGGWVIPGLGFSVGDAYHAGMSMIDSLVGAKVGGKAYRAMMSMGAASSEMAKLYSQGASTEQMVMAGFAAGAAEWIFEKYSIENLISMKSPKTLGQFLKNALMQGGIEASEEMATELANIISNGLIMQSESDWARMLEENGGDYGKALGEMAIQITNAGLSGFLSGAGSGSIQQGMQYGAQQAEFADTGAYITNAGSADALAQLAMEMASGASGSAQRRLTSQSNRLGREFLTEGGKNRAIGRLYNTVRSAMTEQDIAEVSSGLREKGFSKKDAVSIAGALAAQSHGLELTEKQQKILKEFGQNEDVQKAVADILGNKESGINTRSRSMRNFEFDTVRGYVTSQNKQDDREQAKESGEDNPTEDAQGDVEGQYAVSAEGKTLDGDGNAVSIKEISSIKDDRMTLKLEDGRTVDAEDVSYASESEALIYETVARMGVNPSAANVLVNAFYPENGVSAEVYAHGIQEAYRYGQYNYPVQEAAKGPFSSLLAEQQRNTAYRLGQLFGGKQVAKEQATVQKNRTVAKNATTTEKTSVVGKVHFDQKGRVFNELQETALTTMEQLSAALGVEFYVYESYVNKAGERVYKDADGNEVHAPNGWYDSNSGAIHIDLNAGQDGKGTMLFTVAHELTHFIRQWSPAKFKVLSNFLVKQYGEKGVSVSELVQRQMDKAKRSGRELTWEEAHEEMVADSMETMLTDGNVVQVMADLKQQDKGLWEKIKDWFRDLAEKLQRVVDAYKGVQPDTAEGRMVADMQDVIGVLQSLYEDALADAGENFKEAIGSTVEANAKSVAAGVQIQRFETAKHSERQQYNPIREKFAKDRLDKLSSLLGDLFPLSSGFEAAIRNDKTPVSNMIVTENSIKKVNGESYYTAAKNAFKSVYGAKTSFTIMQLGISAEADSGFARESISKLRRSKEMQTILDLTPEFKSLIEDSRLLAVERTLHNDNKKTSLLCYRLYNAYIREEAYADQSGKMQTRKVPHIVVFNVVQNLNDAKAHMVTDINDVAIYNGHNSSKLKYAAQANGNIIISSIADVYNVVKQIDRKNGGVRYSPSDNLLYGFSYTEKNSGGKYSDRDPAAGRVNEVLQKENTQLKEDVQYLKDLLKIQKTVTNGTKFTKTSVEAMASILMKGNNVKGDKKELAKLLNAVYEYIARGEELTWEGVAEMAQPAVDWLRSHTVIKSELSQYAQDILHDVRTSRVSLDASQQAEVAYRYGSFNDFRKAMMGSIVIAKDGVPLDIQWQEWASTYPDVFNVNMSASDMPGALADVISSLRNSDLSRAEYAYHADMIAQDLLQQVYDGYWRVSTLRTVADVKQRQINELRGKHYQKMNDLRQFHLEKTDQLKREHRADMKRIRQEYREASERKQKQIIERYQESRKKATEGRNKTAMRHKIQRVVDELNRYLLHGTKERHVPEGLQKAVAGILDSLNMEVRNEGQRKASFEATLARYDRQIAMESDPEKVRELIEKRKAYEEKGDQFKAKMEALKLAYDEIQNSEDPLLSNAYDDGLSAHMMTLIVEVGDTPLGEMSLKQLECVYDVCRIVQTTIRNANKAFKAAKNASIAELGSRVMQEVSRMEKGKKYDLAAMEAIRKFGWNNLKPVYAFETIGSDTFTEIFNNVRKGEDVWAKDVTEARKFYLEKAKKYGYDSWDFDKRYTFESTSGMDFSLSLEQIMSLYAYSKRDQAADHLRKGGIVFDESTEVTMKTKLGINAKFNPTEATAYNISPETLADIVSKLTKEQKGYVDEMQEYLSTVMGNKGNEVSMEMYGIKLFKEKFYFPLKSASQFMAKAKEQQQGEVKIKNSGFSKETTKKASNPIVLTPFMNVWADHVNEMSMYHAFVLPMEDFYRVYNYRTATSDMAATESVEMHLQNAFGKGATKYIDQLLKDLNGGARTDSTAGVINRMMGMFKKGAVFASASVVVQQPSAIARAAALVDTKYFIGPKMDRKRHKALWEEVKQYAPVAIIKEMGYFDTNMGKSTQDFILGKEYSGFSEKMKALVTDGNYRDEVLSKAPALADEIAWCSIWEAVKRETLAKYPTADTRSELFLKKAGERFTEVIVKTQVYDSVLSRSANMRSKDTGMKMATAFMAEPTTSINMIADALMKGKSGTVQGRKYCRRTIGAVIASQILNAFLVSFVYAARDDDEEETYWEKYAGSFTAEMLDGMNPLTYIPFIKDMVSIAQGYTVERSDMAVISDLWNAVQNLKSDKLSAWRKVEGFVGSICQIFGLPVKNIMRDMRGVWQAFDTIVNGEDGTWRGMGYAIKSSAPKWMGGGDTPGYEQLYEARLAGDEAHEARVEARYEDEDAADAAVRLAIKNHFMEGQIDTQTALRQMVLYTGMDASEAHWLMDAWEYRKAMGTDEGYSMYNRFFEAVQTGKNLKATIKEYTDNGVKETTLTSMITKHFKSEYIEMSASERTAIKDYLLNAYEQCGVDREEAEERLADWEFEAKHGFDYSNRRTAYLEGTVSAAQLQSILVTEGGYTEEDAAYQIKAYDWEAQGYEDVTLAAVRAYEQFCEAAGVPKSVFLHIRDFSNNTENDVDEEGKTVYYSAMKKVMAEINAQDLSAEQKTAVAQSMGWSEKNIKKYKLW